MGYIKRTFFEIYLKWAIIWEIIKYHESFLYEYLFKDLLKWDILKTFFEIYLKWAIIWEIIKYHESFLYEYLFKDLLKWDILKTFSKYT